ncbi:Agamous-like MADS-box protein AGL35 [Rhynchospora pubera]|uniref:Agamous-like MADS-box protein AGL35 n=1 Tax=Rhynchospora pubera TaxID=906938 RepID=A0AAV8CWF3_9POAL|nr:Agamous-like MADS-box protein AGL35 [Rhynchospora pubera]
MELIGKLSVRSATFRKRRASLFKKANELAILCGVEVSIVVAASPDDPAPEIWPSLEEAANMASYASAYTTNKKDNQTKKVAQQVADMQVELKKLEMENQELEAQLFLEETLSGRSQVADLASPELAMRLWAMIDNRRMVVQHRINTLLSLPVSVSVPVPFQPTFAHMPVLSSDIPEETPWLFNHLTADMTNQSELRELMQIDGGPLIECWPAEVDVGAENNANLPAQGPANCGTMEDVIGADPINAIPSEHTPLPSAVLDIGQPGLIDLPDETNEPPAVIPHASELYGADGLQVENEASRFYCPVYDEISERIDVILSSFSRF